MTHQGAENAPSRKTAPVNWTTRNTSERASILAVVQSRRRAQKKARRPIIQCRCYRRHPSTKHRVVWAQQGRGVGGFGRRSERFLRTRRAACAESNHGAIGDHQPGGDPPEAVESVAEVRTIRSNINELHWTASLSAHHGCLILSPSHYDKVYYVAVQQS